MNKYLRAGVTLPVIGLLGAQQPALAEEADAQILDTVSVTATRAELPTKDVPSAIAVITDERLEKSPQFNLSETLNEIPGVLMTPTQNAYDARLIIRGAGLKANYGIREITLLRDGVPLTDPDSFTRLDFIDTQDIERIEVDKTPGNLYAAGSAGGTIQIFSRSAFDHDADSIRVGAGNYGKGNVHVRYSTDIGANQALAGTLSYRQVDNDWRRWNEFDTTQLSLKHGMFFGDDHVWETELSYNEANMQIPGSMDQAQYEEFKKTGEQTDNNSPFKHAGRYSDTWFFNTRMELDYGNFTVQPRLYYNVYEQYHPVTGFINVAPGTEVYGFDLETNASHKLGSAPATFSGGFTLRRDVDDGSKRYEYRDFIAGPPVAFFPGAPTYSIQETTSDAQGDLMETKDNKTSMDGLFVNETIELSPKNTLQAGARVDLARISLSGNEITAYNYYFKAYTPGVGEYSLERDFTLWAPRLGLTHKFNNETNLFVNLSQADQIPFANELDKNPDLDKSTTQNFELGLKQRSRSWTIDTSVYFMRVEDEIVSYIENGDTLFENAGKTRKDGFEFAGTYRPVQNVSLGLNYAYSRYRYESFSDAYGDYSGNQLPYIPEHKYTLFADAVHPSGWTGRISLDTWGSYYMDNANTEKYEGYQFVTNAFVGYQMNKHRFGLNIDNIFDEYYANEAQKDAFGNYYYDAASPRSFLLTYTYDL